MIPNRPPPQLKEPSKWSKEFVDFISKCLVKEPNDRYSAQQLLEHPFIASTVNRLQLTHGVSNTMRNMLSRLRELRSLHQKAEKKTTVVVNSDQHGVNDTLVPAEREEEPRENRTVFVEYTKCS